jgi:hypothetical protein
MTISSKLTYVPAHYQVLVLRTKPELCRPAVNTMINESCSDLGQTLICFDS